MHSRGDLVHSRGDLVVIALASEIMRWCTCDSPALAQVLSASHHTEFLRRWNVYTYKLDKAALYISLHNHEHAMYYLLSLQHEIQALRDIIRIGGRGLHTKMACKKIYANKKQDNSRVWYVVWLCILGICWWIFSRRTAGGPVLIRERVKRDQ